MTTLLWCIVKLSYMFRHNNAIINERAHMILTSYLYVGVRYKKDNGVSSKLARQYCYTVDTSGYDWLLLEAVDCCGTRPKLYSCTLTAAGSSGLLWNTVNTHIENSWIFKSLSFAFVRYSLKERISVLWLYVRVLHKRMSFIFHTSLASIFNDLKVQTICYEVNHTTYQ
jgi:hypothetical protein